MRFTLITFSLLFIFVLTADAQVDGYYRHPDIHGDQIVFNAEGDLWKVASKGGSAQRLTSHPGQEMFPVISPDGKMIAFAASYEGSTDTYVMSIDGGTPRRITWLSGRPVGWSPEGQVMVRTRKFAGVPDYRLVLVDPQNGELSQIPLHQAAEGSIAADGTLFFNRMPRQGSNSRFYKGGTAQIMWKFEPGASEAEVLTSDYPGSSRQPNVMADERIYFLSDRQDAMNVWSMDREGSDLKMHTNLRDWDIQELAGDGQTLVYRLGADIWTLTPGSNAPSKVEIGLVTDLERSLVDWETSPWNYLSDTGISTDGKHVGLVSRGELFVAPVGTGRFVHVSNNSGVRYRNVLFSSDSTHVFGLSDRSGELEWWKTPINGIGRPTQISNGPGMLRLDGEPSPDGKYIVHESRNFGLWLIDLEDGKSKEIGTEPIAAGYAWSPDSKYVVYAKGTESLMSALFAYEIETGETTQLTSDRYTDSNPTFSADGNWLFFGSTRTWSSNVGSPWGERAPQPNFSNTSKIYAIPLKEGLAFPFSEPSELTKTKSDSAAMSGPIRWDLGHLLRELPIPAGSHSGLMTNDKRLFYRAGRNLMALDLKAEAEPIQIVEGVRRRTELSADGKKIKVIKGSKIYVIPSSSGKDVKLSDKNEIDLSDWKFAVNKRDEWSQIYTDAWRLHRDYFWDPNMLGVDWTAMRDKYGVLVDRIGSREELADLQGMLVSELSLLHSNAGGGDTQQGEDNVSPASLGGVFERDAATGGFKLTHRYEADPDLPRQWSPLAHPDVQIEEGAIILSVNGRSARSAFAIEALLLDQAGKQVRVNVLDPDGSTRDLIVTPISGRAEYNLKYHNWEHTRRLLADELSDGKVGYVHLRAMGSGDAGQWAREFYSQTHKQGLIVDVRHNNGGNIDSWILGQLLRRAWSYFKMRSDNTSPNMQYSFNGHIVILVDERSSSDGEAVADGFRRLGLGKAIGVRTWGGEVWLTGSNRQVDNGVARASEIGVYGPEGEWLIEGWGFVPDIEVDNLPHATFNGKDAQLEAALAHLQELIESEPRLKPEAPPYPELIPGAGFPTPWKNQ